MERPVEGHGANSVLGKTRLILEAFEIDDADVSLAELARRTGISKPSVHRLAQELVDWGMLERSGQAYRLGMRAFELGSRVPRFRILRDATRPAMEWLHQSTKEVVHLAVRDGRDVLYLEKIASGPGAAKPSRIAGRMPLHCTSTGKALLAHSPEEVVEELLSRPLRPMTRYSTVAPGLLMAQLARVREEGYAVETEEVARGYCSVAIPLLGSGGLLLGALSVTAPTFRADVPRLARTLVTTGERLASALPAGGRAWAS